MASMVDARLEKLGWAQADLANVLGWSVQSVSELLNGRRRVDAVSAMELSSALGSDPHEWLVRQAEHDLWLLSHDPSVRDTCEQIDERRQIEEVLPVRDLVRRGLLPKKDAGAQYAAACDLLEVEDLTQDPPFPIVARRSNRRVPVTRQQRAWVACARKQARDRRVRAYSPARLEALGAALSQMVLAPEDIVEVPRAYARVGVRLVHVEPFPGGRIDGVSTRVDDTAVIALSGRGGRMDKVLYTLAHETAHLVLGHLEQRDIFVSEADADGTDRLEAEADSLAASWLVPDLEGLRHGLVTGQRVDQLARQMGVSDAVIVGRLQKEGLIPWNSMLNKRIPSVKEAIRMWS